MYDWLKFKQRQFHYVTKERAPCDGPYVNQCALRVSRALFHAGFPFDSSNKPYETGPLCAHGFARGAKSLADYLWKYYKRPVIYTKLPHPTTGEIFPEIGSYSAGEFIPILKILEDQRAKGIIFFDNPHHIDGFDYEDKTDTTNNGIIGEEYVRDSNEVWVYKF